MGQLEDIERLRKKRNRRQNLKRLGAFLLVLAIFFGGWFAWEKIKQTSLAEQLAGGIAELGSGGGYPLEFSGATVRQTAAMGNVLLVLTDTHLHIYNKNGKLLREVQHDYPNPVMKCSSSRILLYDPSSKILRVESKTKTVQTMTFEFPVLFAVLSDQNDLAVITNTPRFLGQIEVYDSSLEEPVFSWKSAESYLYGAAFAPGGDAVAVSSVQVQNGDLVSGLTLYRLDAESPFLQQQYVDETIHDLDYQNGELQVLTDQTAYYYSESGKEKASVSFQDEPLRMFCSKGEKVSALLLGDYQEFKSIQLSLLGGSGEERATVSLSSQVEAIDVCKNRTALLSENRIEIYDAKGELIKEVAPDTEVLFLALGSGYVYYVTPDALCQEPLS
ncbi:MAG: DUF5711 family protein [Oscillospiraceae bacterium]|nr:DUF5711 family protein [Oscillospiraceae bacterium]